MKRILRQIPYKLRQLIIDIINALMKQTESNVFCARVKHSTLNSLSNKHGMKNSSQKSIC